MVMQLESRAHCALSLIVPQRDPEIVELQKGQLVTRCKVREYGKAQRQIPPKNRTDSRVPNCGQ